MTGHPFPPPELPRKKELVDATLKLAEALEHFRREKDRKDGASFGDSISVHSENGTWLIAKAPELRKSRELSAHERIAHAEAIEKAGEGALALVEELPNAICERIKFSITFESEAIARIYCRTLTRDNVAAAFKALPATLPVAGKALNVLGIDAFLPPHEFRQAGIRTAIRERTREKGFSDYYRTLSLKVECPEAPIESVVGNAFAHAVLIGALRDGIADPSDFEIETMEMIAADAYRRDKGIADGMIKRLNEGGALPPGDRQTRQTAIDKLRDRR
jgi:hypothetical protein